MPRGLRNLDDQIRVMREHGHTLSQIASVLRVSESHVSRTLRYRLRIVPEKRPKPTPAHVVRSSNGRGALAGNRARRSDTFVRHLVRHFVPPLAPLAPLPVFGRRG